jgi:nicotinate-nucleotide adenylyltransferase
MGSRPRSAAEAPPADQMLPYAMPGQRIGLLGGSFNPAHDGHRRLSLHALKRLGLDRVWWVVTPGNPLKTADGLAELSERMAVARAVSRHPRIVVTSFEAGLPTAYTADTIAFLKRRYPETFFVWLMGADNLAQLNRWSRWRSIIEAVPMAVFDRPGWRHKARSSLAAHRYADAFVSEESARQLPSRRAPAWTLITMPLSSLSSTAIRQNQKKSGRSSPGRS